MEMERKSDREQSVKVSLEKSEVAGREDSDNLMLMRVIVFFSLFTDS
jgi:hypothetical protein